MNKSEFKKSNIKESKHISEDENKYVVMGYAAGKVATAALAGAALHTLYEKQAENPGDENLEDNELMSSNETIETEINSIVESAEAEDADEDGNNDDINTESLYTEVEESLGQFANVMVASEILHEDEPERFAESKTEFQGSFSVDEDMVIESVVMDSEAVDADSAIAFEPENYDSSLDTGISEVASEALPEEPLEVPADLEFEEYTNLDEETSEVVSEIMPEESQEVVAELVFEEYTDLDEEMPEVVSEVLSEEPQELTADLEFEEYVDADDEYDSVSVLFDDEEDNTLLSFNDDMETSRMAEDSFVDDDADLSDFENDADVSSFM